MNVCFYIDTLNGTGGTERITATLSNYLVNNGVNVTILSKRGGKKSFYQIDSKIKVYAIYDRMDVNIYKNYVQTIRIYRSILSDIKPDVIINIGVNLSLETIPATLGNKCKIISWEHFNAKVYHNFYINYISKLLAAKFSERIVVLTAEDKEVYQRKFYAKNVSVIPYPVSIDVTGYAYNSESKYVLNVGRLTKQKGTDLLLESWALVNKCYPDWKLRIVGEGEWKEQLYSQAQRLNIQKSVEFVAPTLNVITHFKEASIFVMSSRYEGLPLVMIEAKCFGLPMVSFDCDTGPRQIIRDKIDGLLVEPENYELLAQGIIELIESKDSRINYSQEAKEDGNRFAPSVFYSHWNKVLNMVN